MSNVRTLIVGAGVSGLAAAAFSRDPDYLVLEADREIGGYCKTVKQGRLRLGLLRPLLPLQAPRDRGAGCAQRMPGQRRPHGREAVVHRLQGPTDRLPVPEEHPPAAAGRVHRLPARSVLRQRSTPAAAAAEGNFKEMLYARFGRSIAEKFLIPYNEKLYACDLGTLDKDAMGRFFPHADLTDIVRNMKAPDNASYNATFTYPEGGAIEYVKALASAVRPEAHRPRRTAASRSISSARSPAPPKREIRFERLVSSAPLQPLRRAVRAAARPGGVQLEQGAGLQPGLRPQGPARRATGSTTRTASASFYRVGFYDNIFDERPHEPVRRDRLRRAARPSTSRRPGRACSRT